MISSPSAPSIAAWLRLSARSNPMVTSYCREVPFIRPVSNGRRLRAYVIGLADRRDTALHGEWTSHSIFLLPFALSAANDVSSSRCREVRRYATAVTRGAPTELAPLAESVFET